MHREYKKEAYHVDEARVKQQSEAHVSGKTFRKIFMASV